MYTNRLHILSSKRKEQQNEINMIVNEIKVINQQVIELYEGVKNQEAAIERRMYQLFGNETEGVSLFNSYSQIKRVVIVHFVHYSYSIH